MDFISVAMAAVGVVVGETIAASLVVVITVVVS